MRFPCPLMAAILIAACHEVPLAPAALPARLSATEAWSGGTVDLTSTAFAPPESLPAVFLGATQVFVRRVNDTTVTATLPTATGSFDVRVIQGHSTTDAGTVTLRGFRDTYQGPLFSGSPYWYVRDGPPILIGEGNTGGALFHLSSNTVEQILPDTIHSPDCAITVGPTYLADTWVFNGADSHGGPACAPPLVRALTPTVHVVDSVGSVTPPAGEAWIAVAEPGPQRWVFDWNNNMLLEDCSSPSGCVGNWRGDRNYPSVTLISPHGDRFLLIPAASQAVVYDVARMDTAYLGPPNRSADGGRFSPDGDTLYLVGHDSAGRAHLEILASTTGALLRDVDLDSLGLPAGSLNLDVVEDPARPWLYLAMTTRTESSDRRIYDFSLLVFDRTSWRLIGIAPASAPFVGDYVGGFGATLVPSPLEHTVYLVGTSLGYGAHGLHAGVWRFDTP